MKLKATVLCAIFFGIVASAAQASNELITVTNNITTDNMSNIIIARGPSGCASEQCCHDKMQQCYDNGGNEECSDRYERCVRNLSN